MTWGNGATSRPILPAFHILDADEIDNFLDEIERLGNQPVCAVKRVAAQSLTNNTAAAVSFDTEVKDTNAMFAATSDTVTIKTAGDFDVFAHTTYADNATGIRVAEILQNGTIVAHHVSDAGGSQSGRIAVAIGSLTCAVNDVIKLQVYQNSGGSLNLTFARMSVKRVGD